MPKKSDNIVSSEKIKQLRNALGKSQAEFGNDLAKSENTIRNWEKEHTPIPSDIGPLLNKIYRVRLEWLYTDNGNMFDSEAEEDQKYVPIQIIEPAGAGHAFDQGMDYDENERLDKTVIMLPEELVNSWRMGFEVRGDSMYPTLKEGDYVGLDMNDKKFINGHLYVIHSPYEGYVVKRLEEASDPDGILLRSDNPYFKDRLIKHENLEHDLQIIGRVAWIFGTRKQHKK